MTWILINMKRFVWQNNWLQLLGLPATPKPPFTTLQLLLFGSGFCAEWPFQGLLLVPPCWKGLFNRPRVPCQSWKKSLSRRDNAATRLRRSLPYARPVSNQRPNNIRCFYCGMAGHRIAQCFRKHRDMASSKSPKQALLILYCISLFVLLPCNKVFSLGFCFSFFFYRLMSLCPDDSLTGVLFPTRITGAKAVISQAFYLFICFSIIFL